MEKQLIDKFLLSMEHNLDYVCPTNISLVELGDILKEPITINYPPPADKFILMKQKYVKFTVYHLLRSEKYKDFSRWLLFFAFITVVQLFKKDIKFCNNEKLQLAIARAKHNHLFKNGISEGIENLVSKVAKKYYDKVTIKNIYLLIYELRHRISQSVKAIARNYMKLSKETERKDCDTISRSLANQLMLYPLEVNNKEYDLGIIGEDKLILLLKYICQNNTKSAAPYLANLFKQLNVSSKEKPKIAKAIKELVG